MLSIRELTSRITTFVGLYALVISPAYAEYYLVYSDPGYPCVSCAKPVFVVRHKTHPVSIHKRNHHTYKHAKSSYRIYYTKPVYGCMPSCTTCGQVVYEKHRFVDFSSRPYTHHAFYYNAEDIAYMNYDPDLATGDDDQMRYPDMDIDR